MKTVNSVNPNEKTDFPYFVLDVVNGESSRKNAGFKIMHWHEDLQFIYVLEGTVEVKTLYSGIRLAAGDGVFINKNVIHFVGADETNHYNSFIFPDYFLKFYLGSPAANLVENVCENNNIQLYPFHNQTDSAQEALSFLKKLSELEENKTDFYQYEVLVLLSALWLETIKNIRPAAEMRESAEDKRMRIFLRYIEKYYSEDISLEALAASANVSKSECLRCFKSTLQTSPYKYITEYRLSAAAKLLINTDKPITEIAFDVGFHHLSHFGKLFREKTGMSPKEYRESQM